MIKGVNAVIFNDCVSGGTMWQRTAGSYRMATELRKLGYTVQVIEYWSFLTLEGPELVMKLLSKFVGSDTMFVGFSTTFMNASRMLFHYSAPVKLDRFSEINTGDNVYCVPNETLKAIKDHLRSINPKTDIIVAGARTNNFDPLGGIKIVGYGEMQIHDYLSWKTGKNKLMLFNTGRFGERQINNNTKADGFDFINSQILWQPEDCIQPNEALPIEISRGCIFKCKFCHYPLNGKSKLDYIKNASALEQEFLRNYELFGTTRYTFVDDTYNDTNEKLHFINKVRKNLPFNLTFGTFARADLIVSKPEQKELLLENGLTSVFFGIESFNTKAARSIGKGMESEKIVDLLYDLRENYWGHNVQVSAGIIYGLPHDTYDTMQEWTHRILDHRFPLHHLSITPLNITNIEKVNNRNDLSDFEKDPKRYGYEMSGFSDWVNRKYGTSSAGVNALTYDISVYNWNNSRLIPSAHIQVGVKDFGFTNEQILLKGSKGMQHHLYNASYARYASYLGDILRLEVE